MPSKSKAKGNAFERAVADDLTKVFGFNFERVPNSGAFVGGKNHQRYDTLSKSQQLIYEGDILVPDELYNMKIECKSYKDFKFHQMFSKCKLLDSWIEQAYSDDKYWALIFKINRKGAFVSFDEKFFWEGADEILTDNYMRYKEYYVVPYDGFFEKTKNIWLQVSSQSTDK